MGCHTGLAGDDVSVPGMRFKTMRRSRSGCFTSRRRGAARRAWRDVDGGGYKAVVALKLIEAGITHIPIVNCYGVRRPERGGRPTPATASVGKGRRRAVVENVVMHHTFTATQLGGEVTSATR